MPLVNGVDIGHCLSSWRKCGCLNDIFSNLNEEPWFTLVFEAKISKEMCSDQMIGKEECETQTALGNCPSTWN